MDIHSMLLVDLPFTNSTLLISTMMFKAAKLMPQDCQNMHVTTRLEWGRGAISDYD